MVLLESTNLELGSTMPTFSLFNPTNQTYTSDQLMGSQGLLIKFTCNHCPYALAVWKRFIDLASYAKPLGINKFSSIIELSFIKNNFLFFW